MFCLFSIFILQTVIQLVTLKLLQEAYFPADPFELIHVLSVSK